MRAKAKKTPVCSVILIAIRLKGLAALGEALKNIMFEIFLFWSSIGREWGLQHQSLEDRIQSQTDFKKVTKNLTRFDTTHCTKFMISICVDPFDMY